MSTYYVTEYSPFTRESSATQLSVADPDIPFRGGGGGGAHEFAEMRLNAKGTAGSLEGDPPPPPPPSLHLARTF